MNLVINFNTLYPVEKAVLFYSNKYVYILDKKLRLKKFAYRKPLLAHMGKPIEWYLKLIEREKIWK